VPAGLQVRFRPERRESVSILGGRVRTGYRVSSTHCNPLGVKTDAPPGVIWDVMRCWALEHPHKRPPDPDSYMGRLLAKAPELKADFSRARVRAPGALRHPAALAASRRALATG
jgi:hypothetical protein